MYQARTLIEARIPTHFVSQALINAIGQLVFKYHVDGSRVMEFVNALAAKEKIPIPRWVQTLRDAYRWAQSLIYKIAHFGAAWWDKLDALQHHALLKRKLREVKKAVFEGNRCPRCNQTHSRQEWEDGVDRFGRLNCAGKLRLAISDSA